MFYDNPLPSKNLAYKTITLPPFDVGQNSDYNQNLLSFKKANCIYNFNITDGALSDGYGFKSLTLPTSTQEPDGLRAIDFTDMPNILGVWQYSYYSDTYQTKQYAVVMYGEDKQLYWCKMFSPDNHIYALYDNTFEQLPIVLNYRLDNRDILIFTSPIDGMLVWDGDTLPYKITTAPTIKSMCLHKDILFAITQDGTHSIRYSKQLNPTSWLISGNLEDSGFIDISDQQGGMNKILSFLGYLFVFRDYAITKIAFYDEDGEYNISQLYFSGSKIFADTVCVCGDKILLMSNDGIYSFDGLQTTKLDLGINTMFAPDNHNASAVFFNDKYYLACKLNFKDDDLVCDEQNDNYVNNALIVYDTQTKQFTITRGVDIKSMLPVEEEHISKIIFCKNSTHSNTLGEITNDGCYYNQILPKKWQSNLTDLSLPTKQKIIKNIYITTKSDCVVTVKTQTITKSYNLIGSEYCQTIRCNLKGKLISLSITSKSPNAYIQPPTIYLGVED